MKKTLPMLVLLAITGLETLALFAAAAFYVFEISAGNSKSLPTMLALTVLICAAGVWSAAVVKALIASKAWARSASVFIQTAMLAIAFYSFQPPVPRPEIAWALIAPAVTVLVLLFTKPLSENFKREV